jgi:2-C-methyl-D-erythritol 2,4-cyclodiphosphate synthase
MVTVRIGQGFDAHRFAAGRPLKLCGVELPDEPGLEGHSDADAALHAVTDAVFGALAAGDLGEFFPSTDERWRDADSRALLEQAVVLAARRGWRVVNLDLTIIGERPRIASHRTAFRRSLAELLGVDQERVSVKATTTDGMGWTGRGEGLAALAVVLIERPCEGTAGVA